MSEETTVEPMTSEEAAEFAPQWGSMVTGGDPGSCMYGFDGFDGRPQSEDHRENCITYMEKNLMAVKADPDRWTDEEAGQDPDDVIEEIEQFLAWMRECDVKEPDEDSSGTKIQRMQKIRYKRKGVEVRYGDVVDALEELGHEAFAARITSGAAWEALTQCVNRGIDAHLEAITDAPAQFDRSSEWIGVTPANLCVLLRRLGERDEYQGLPGVLPSAIKKAAVSFQDFVFDSLDIRRDFEPLDRNCRPYKAENFQVTFPRINDRTPTK